jgi:hypothetical protein
MLVRVTVAPEGIALGPGDSADVEVTIQNASQVVEHFATSIVGLPRQDLYSCEPSVVKLRPKETGTVRVRITVPEHAGPIAGRYTLGVLVTSPYQREVSRCEELVLDVQPVPAMSVNTQPEVALGGPAGNFAVTVVNDGNTPLAVTLAGGDPENRVGFEFEPRELRMAPGMAANARLVVRADAPLTGQEVRRAMTLRAHAGELTVEKPLTFVQRPRIAGGLLKMSGLAAAVALMAGATVGGAMLIRSTKQVAQVNPIIHGQGLPTTAKQSPTQGGQATSGGAPPTSGAAATSGGAVPSGTTLVDFTRTADGQAPGDQIIPHNAYAAKGITLSALVDNAPADCADATAVALRTAGTLGSFLSSAKPADASACSNRPIRMDFAAPVRLVNLRVIGDGTDYTMTAVFSDGNTDIKKVTTQSGVIMPIQYEPPTGSAVTAIIYGHANPDPTAKDPTIIKSIAFTPA